MRHRSPVLLPLGLGAIAALACASPGGGAPAYRVPLLADIAPEADDALDLVDRSEVLLGAREAADASEGAAPDLAAAPEGMRMVFDSRGMDDASGLTSGSYEDAPPGPVTQLNVFHAAAMVAIADAQTTLLIGVPAAAAGIALDGVTTEIAPNVWASTNAVSDGTVTVTGLFTVAWVDVGWLAEMRLWSSDGAYDDTVWYRGFLSEDAQVGWWDFYDASGTLAGVIEWVDDGAGQGELGLTLTSGGDAGDLLLYLFLDDTGFVGFHDEPSGQEYSVFAAEDHSGQLVDPQWNGGAPACWDPAGNDAACP